MDARPIDPLRNFRFRLEIDGIIGAGFSEVAIADTSVDLVEYRDGWDEPHSRKLSGLTKYGNITLKWGMTAGPGNALQLYNWHKDVATGLVKTSRKTVAIVVQDEAKKDSARFVVSYAWPIKYHSSDLSGKGNEVVIEMLELVNEGIERTV